MTINEFIKRVKAKTKPNKYGAQKTQTHASKIMTIKEFIKRVKAKTKPNKYGAQKTQTHASKKEESRASQLKLKQKLGQIYGLREQIPYELIPAQRDPKGKLIERPCKYIADFVYNDAKTGELHVEDVKGYRTKEYIIKRKLMLYIHGIHIEEI